jgi:hypothetical protein
MDNIMLRNNNYNHREAVQYALRYGMNPNPSYRFMGVYQTVGGDCSNFISQCLRAGGAPWPLVL